MHNEHDSGGFGRKHLGPSANGLRFRILVGVRREGAFTRIHFRVRLVKRAYRDRRAPGRWT